MPFKLFNKICLLVLICCTKLVNAQVKAELIYPVVPLADDCHFVFDDTSQVQVISLEEFLAIDKLWITQDLCYNQIKDTFFALEFEVVFENSFGEANAMFHVVDGHLNSAYQSSLNAMRTGVKSYTKVHFQNIKYKIDGALYQVKPLTIVIDSLVKPKIDSCWTQMPLADNSSGFITKDSLIYLFQNKFGYNNCTDQQNWPDSSAYATVLLAPQQDLANANVYLPGIDLISKRHWEKLIMMINDLNAGDIVEVNPLIYLQNDELFKSRRIRYTIVDSIIPLKTIVIRNLDSLIVKIRNQENLENICLNYQKGEILSFFMIAAPKSKPASLATSSNSCLTPQMIQMIKALEIGDKLIFERIKTPDHYHKTYYNVIEPIVIDIK